MTVFYALLLLVANPDQLRVDVPAKVTAELLPESLIENHPTIGIISIIRERRQKVDEASFTIDEKPLKVRLIDEAAPQSLPLFQTTDADSLVVSRYRFSLPKRPAGKYVLTPITVKVGDIAVSSPEISYEIYKPKQSNELRLEARLLTNETIYPGQVVTFEYRIYFQKAVDLLIEQLALIQMPAFQNRGAPKLETVSLGHETLQTITTEAKALKAGEFQSGTSRIVGLQYILNSEGKQYVYPPLEAIGANITVNVVPFPEINKPSSFNGSLGLFTYNAKLERSNTVFVGDTINLIVEVSGRGDLDTVEFPDISHQKGFSNFSIGSQPITGKIIGPVKRFVIPLTPLTSKIREIPAIEFSSFDPVLQRYFTISTKPIPLIVERMQARQETSGTSAEAVKEPLEIESNLELHAVNIEAPYISLRVMSGIAFLVILLLCIELLARMLVRRARASNGIKTSRELFLMALKRKDAPNVALPLMVQALLLGLQEVGETENIVKDPIQLSTLGLQGDIRKFLVAIDERRFGTQKERAISPVDLQDLLSEASELYYRLRQGTKRSNVLPMILFGLFLILPQTLSAQGSFSDSGYFTYVTAEKADSIAARQVGFNEALSIYLHMLPKNPSGELLYNIGNCYFQLQEYGLAIAYYYRAEKLLPRNEKIAINLQTALKKVGLKQEEEPFWHYLLFYIPTKLSPYEQELLLIATLVMFFCFASLAIWLQIRFFKRLALFSLFIALFVVASFLWREYLAGVEAVIIKPTPLFESVAETSEKSATPLTSGMKVRVLRTVPENNVVEIQLPSGDIGYVSKDKIAII